MTDYTADDFAKAKAARDQRLQQEAEAAAAEADTTPLKFDDFYLCSEQHQYIYLPTGALWPATSVNGRLPKKDKLKAAAWLDKYQAVEQMTWAPAAPTLIKDQLLLHGGWVEHKGALVYNHYRPPRLEFGNPGNAQAWIEHVNKVYPEDGERIIGWCAYRCQHPDVKINHALVLGGTQGIGKDTLLEPVRHALGQWNCRSISPSQLVGRFNGFLKTTLLQVSEARDLGEVSRYSFYDHTKDIIAAPPDVLLVDEKNTHEYLIPNLTGVILTTNYKAGGIYLPAEDRRHLVCWSSREPKDFNAAYWDRIWDWYDYRGGLNDVAAFLHNRDVTAFDPKAPPPKTTAFWEMVNASRAPEFAELEDALQKLGYPSAVTLQQLVDCSATDEKFRDWLRDHRNRPRLPRRFEECGYVIVQNPDAKNGLWRISGTKQMAYAKAELPFRERVEAVRRLGYTP